ncbi:NUDIX domain-containing protein [Bacillus lacus]|uniref:NUDIX domain-containing protein n=1 Tax=Metabacillus lacus TaxID=1983721 RepID=A0A7X2J0I8_9BACI|nr:NUDIX hydrolase [Metabacillus lacus]MRX73201.1 NUDIX domain-containing protein [Metabacillus lacus]
MGKRGNIWLGVSGLVTNEKGEWLVVKKKYGGLKGQWSFPAGFVDEAETLHEAVLREIREETGVEASIDGIIGVRSGVLLEKISDNMIIFKLSAKSSEITVQEDELEDVQFLSPAKLGQDPSSSLLLVHFAKQGVYKELHLIDDADPGKQFGYSSYTLFL